MVEREAILLTARELIVLIVVAAVLVWAFRAVRKQRR
jgi:hypothetical protein